MTKFSPEELRAMLARIVAAPSPFYLDRLQEKGLHVAGGPTDLARLPLTTRHELLRDQLDHLPHGTRRFADAAPPVRTGVTGSGATLLVLTWTAADLARERAAGRRLLGRLGITAGMRVANALPGALATPGSLLLGDVVEEIGALDIPLGAITSAAAARAAWEMFDRVQAAVLVLDAASAGALFAAAPPAVRPWWQGIVWLQTDGASGHRPPLPTVTGFAGWQRTWLAVPEATSFVAQSCGAGRFHMDEGLVVEVVDPASSTTVLAGESGEFVLTPLGVDTPVLRYRSGMRGRLVGACACGGDGAVLELAAGWLMWTAICPGSKTGAITVSALMSRVAMVLKREALKRAMRAPLLQLVRPT